MQEAVISTVEKFLTGTKSVCVATRNTVATLPLHRLKIPDADCTRSERGLRRVDKLISRRIFAMRSRRNLKFADPNSWRTGLPRGFEGGQIATSVKLSPRQ